MRVFKADEWKVSTDKEEIFEVSDLEYVQIECSCTEDVILLGLRQEEKSPIPLHIGRQWSLKTSVQGFKEIRLTSMAEFGFRYRALERQAADPLNDEDPPAPPLPGADNLVAQMHRIAKEHSRRHSPPYLDPEELPFANRYTIAEDDEQFEEEIFASQRKRKEEELADAQAEAQASLEPAAEPQPANDPPPAVAQAAE